MVITGVIDSITDTDGTKKCVLFAILVSLCELGSSSVRPRRAPGRGHRRGRLRGSRGALAKSSSQTGRNQSHKKQTK